MTTRTRSALAAAVAALALLAARGHAFRLEQLGCFAPGVLLGEARLSGDGRTLVFTAAADVVPGANPHGLPQLFALDLDTRAVRQLTPADFPGGRPLATCTALDAAVSHDASRIVGLAMCGHAAEDRRWRLYDVRGATTAPLGRWTVCAPTLTPQALSGDGRRLVLDAACNPAHAALETRPARWRLWAQDRPGGRMRPFGPRGRCESLAPALDEDGGRVAFLSDCDRAGENPTHAMNLFTRDAGGRVRQLTHAVHGDAGGRCGRLQRIDRLRSGLFETPAVAAAGPTILAAPCIAEGGAPRALLHRLWAFAAGGSDVSELPVPPCPEGSLGRVVASPVAASRGARRVAFVRACLDATVVRGEQALVVLDAGAPPRAVLANAGRRVLVDREIRRPAMDAGGRVLVTVSAEPPPGCAGAGVPQLVVARDLDDPVLREVACGCGAG